jgi:hypothetical protein
MKDMMESRLADHAMRVHRRTGQQATMVMVEKEGQNLALHTVEFDPLAGLLIDGRPPSTRFYQEAEDFHPLEMAPVLH